MSKVSSSNFPLYSGSTVSIGNSKATTGVSGGSLVSEYQMSEPESAIYNYALNTLASILPGVNTFDTNTQNSINSQVDAYKNSGISDINSLYQSSLANIENDAASRFGNLDNSIFTDKMNSLESERAKAVSSFAQDVLAKQSDLESNELSKRYALVDMLNGLTDDIYTRALKAISTALTGSSSANDYNNSYYDAISALQKSSSNSLTSSNSLLSGLLGSNTSALSSLFTM